MMVAGQSPFAARRRVGAWGETDQAAGLSKQSLQGRGAPDGLGLGGVDLKQGLQEGQAASVRRWHPRPQAGQLGMQDCEMALRIRQVSHSACMESEIETASSNITTGGQLAGCKLHHSWAAGWPAMAGQAAAARLMATCGYLRLNPRP